MQNRTVYITFLLVTLTIGSGDTSGGGGGRKPSINRYEEVEEYDPVAVTRCDARCLNLAAAEKEQVTF